MSSMIFPRSRAAVAADVARAKEDRVLVVPPAIRRHLYDLPREEVRSLEARAREVRRKRALRRSVLEDRADAIRALVDELAP